MIPAIVLEAVLIAAAAGIGADLLLVPLRRHHAVDEAARLLRSRFASGEIDAGQYETGMWILGLGVDRDHPSP